MVWWASQFRFKQLLLQISLANQLGIHKTNQLSYYKFYSIGPESGRTPPRKHGIWWYESAEPQGWYAGDTWHRIVPGCSFQRLYRFDLDPGRVSMRRTAASSDVQDSWVLSIMAENRPTTEEYGRSEIVYIGDFSWRTHAKKIARKFLYYINQLLWVIQQQ